MSTAAEQVVAWRSSSDAAGTRMLVIHGDQDTIPRELLDRTWAYLDGDAGSATAVRDPSGHELSPTALAALHDWLTTTLHEPGAPA